MNKYSFILLVIVFGCSSKKGIKPNELLNIQGDRSRKTIHNYTYDKSGRIILDAIRDYNLINGVITDSTRSTVEYLYKGNLLQRIVTKSQIPSLSENEWFFYDHKDSLIMKVRIGDQGDTIHQDKTSYDAAGNKVEQWEKRLREITTVEELKENPGRIVYDTFIMKWENTFKGNLLTRSMGTNKSGEPQYEHVYSYAGDRQSKVETFRFMGTTRYPYSTTTYDYSKYAKGEFETVNSEGTLLEFLSVTLKDGRLFSKNFVLSSGYGMMTYYNKAGQVIYEVELSTQTVTSYTYDGKGNKKEVHRYKMRASDTKRQLDSMYHTTFENDH